MCGIIGIISKKDFSTFYALEKLERLEYRGYDSCGIATLEGYMAKTIGDVETLKRKVKNVKISWTKWKNEKVRRRNGKGSYSSWFHRMDVFS